MKIGKIIVSILLAASMMTAAACSVGGGEDDKGGATPPPIEQGGSDADGDGDSGDTGNGGENQPAVSYTVTFNENFSGGKSVSVKTGADGKVAKPADPTQPEKNGKIFDGWYTKVKGGELFDFNTVITADLTLYAHWTDKTSEDNPTVTYTVTFDYNYDGAPAATTAKTNNAGKVSKPTAPTRTPTAQKSYTFDDWYTAATGGSKFDFNTVITADKTLYAHWVEHNISVDPSNITITDKGGYEEGAYIEFSALDGLDASDYTVTYKISGGSGSGKQIDRELIRESGDGMRADIVGISAGTYDITVTGNDKTATATAVTVTKYDRSGYAHFNYSGSNKEFKFTDGIGAYKNDGTPKDGAKIYYVTESNKNNVDGKGTSVAQLLENSPNLVIVRIIGTVGSATWKDDSDMDYKEKYGTTKITPDKVVGKNGNVISQKKWNQSELKDVYNDLDTSVYSEINGLTSYMSYNTSKDEFDSYWNMCDISNAEDVTVEGIGTDARIFQWGFTWDKCSSIEVRNLTFDDYTEDACSFQGDKSKTKVSEFPSHNIWVHHNTFLEGINYWDVCNEQDKHDGDGSTDFKGVANVTISYNHYYNNHKTGLVGGSDSDKTANLTFHHNYYDGAWSRLPLGRQANMHMYNNYYKAGSKTSYFISVRATAFVFAENCYFDLSGKSSANIIDCYSEKDLSSSKKAGYAKLYNCYIKKGSESKQLTSQNFSITQSWAVRENFIKVVTSRTESLAAVSEYKNVTHGDCLFGQNFDTNSSLFYYKNGKSDVTVMHEAADLPTLIPTLAGVHKNKVS